MNRRSGRGLCVFLTLASLSLYSVAAWGAVSLEQIPTPNPGSAANSLIDIAAVQDGTAWAVGSRSGPTTLPLLLRFDGNDWTEFPIPSEVDGIAFSTSTSTPEGDVWLTGTRAFSVYDRELFFLRARGNTIDRIDRVLSAGAPIDLSANSGDDVWALTGAGDVIRFDGSEWTESPVPQVFATLNYPKAIHAAGPDDVWIAGYGGDQRGHYEGYVQHWDGSSWSLIPTPVSGETQTFLRDMDGSGINDVWIVGDSATQHLSLHWDGVEWSRVSAPPSNAGLCEVIVLGPGEVWAAPYSLSPGSSFARWDGNSWVDGPSLALPGASTMAWRGLTARPTGDVWAAGSYYVSPSHLTLVAQLSTDTTTAAPNESPTRAFATVQVHPNPFNPVTTLRYRLDQPGAVSLDIYDAQGRLQDRLLERVWREAGAHEQVYSPNAPSGVYFARLVFGNESITTKLVLAK